MSANRINRTYIGDPLNLYDGQDLSVYVEQWANEAVDTIAIDGPACLIFFDPGAKAGRAIITGLITNLQAALARHDAEVADIYTNLKPGDDPHRVRVADEKETRCPSVSGTERCVRVEHVDPYHLTIEDTAATYTVRSVWQA